MKFTLGLCTLSLIFLQSDARPSFVARIPNGNGVTGVAALGHMNTAGGGATNSFGRAFGSAGMAWTKELCQADSDGDGATNGEELGDPCCIWTSSTGFDGSSTSAAMQSPTHPGVPNSFTTSQLAAISCGEADLDSVASSGAASSTSSTSDTSMLAFGSQSATSSGFGGSLSSSSGSFDAVVTPDIQPHFSPSPKLDQTSPAPVTSYAENLKSSVIALYCFSILALALAL